MVTTHDFDTVFREVFPRLVSLGVLKTGRSDVARDLAQETMLRAHARWEEVGTYDAPAAWCRTVMTRLLIDHHRSAAAELRAVERLGNRPATADTSTPHLDRWHELLEPLSDRQRLVVTLYYADDRSVAEIATATGASRAAVKKTLFTARAALRRRLDETDGGRHG